MASKSFWDNIQFGLDIAGTFPLAGNIVDLANAGISAVRGDAVGAGLRLAQAVPVGGQGVTATKLATQGAGKGIKSLSGKGVDSAVPSPGLVNIRGSNAPGPKPKGGFPTRPQRGRSTTSGAGPRESWARPGLQGQMTASQLRAAEKAARPLVQTERAARKSAKLKAARDAAKPNQSLRRRMVSQALKRRPIIRTISLARPEQGFDEDGQATSEDIAKTIKDREKARQEEIEKMIDDQSRTREIIKDADKQWNQADADRPLMQEGWEDRKKVLKDQISALEPALEESQEERRKQLGNRLINAMTAAGTANPNYWSKHPDKLQAIIREGKKLGNYSFDEDDVKRVLKANYKKAVQQKKQDIYEADSRKGLDFVQGKIDDWNIQRAIDRKDEVLPAAELRRRGQRMKGLIGETGYKEKDYQFGGEDIKPQEMESSLKGAKKELEDMGLAENEAYSDWMEEAAKKES